MLYSALSPRNQQVKINNLAGFKLPFRFISKTDIANYQDQYMKLRNAPTVLEEQEFDIILGGLKQD